MPIAALVVTLDPDLAHQQHALRALASDAQLTLGERHGLRLPVVVEADDDQDALSAMQRTERTVGVSLVEVVSVDFSDVDTTDIRPTDGRRNRTEQ